MSRGLYIHVPFCIRKCRYCDFFSVTDISLAKEYVRAVIRNISAVRDSFSSVYFGGGTPSLLSPEQIYEILSAANIHGGCEISMEVNPGTVGEKYFTEVRSAGINRVSIGVQSFDDGELRALGRIHSAEEASAAVLSAKKAGFENISADIMLGIPKQTMESLENSLSEIPKLPLKHISAYMLKVEPETPLSKDKELLEAIPDDEITADIYLKTAEFLEKHGFEQYEISNFAKVGFECRHNLLYWHCGEYYGIGPAAHGYINGERFRCGDTIEKFISSELQGRIFVDKGGSDGERAMLSLRLTKEGIPAETISDCERVEPLIKNGLMKKENGFLRLTPKGCLVSNEIILFCGLLNERDPSP